jgi:hypothetical protein
MLANPMLAKGLLILPSRSKSIRMISRSALLESHIPPKGAYNHFPSMVG